MKALEKRGFVISWASPLNRRLSSAAFIAVLYCFLCSNDVSAQSLVWAPQQHMGFGGTPFGTTNGPSLAVYGNRLYAAWKGAEGDNSIWWSSSDGKSWARQQHMGFGGIPSAPPTDVLYASGLAPHSMYPAGTTGGCTVDLLMSAAPPTLPSACTVASPLPTSTISRNTAQKMLEQASMQILAMAIAP
jgi:hypothetical protein